MKFHYGMELNIGNRWKKFGLIVLGIIILVFLFITFFYHKKGSDWNALTSNVVSSEKSSCTAEVLEDVTLYSRPTDESGIFGHAEVGDKIDIVGKTSDGWYAFDPASAQAANVGPFRYRYFKVGLSSYKLGKDCEKIPATISLPATTCFMMAQETISLYQNPSAKSAVVATMKNGDYIPVVGKTVGATNYWIKVDGSSYSTMADARGWIESKYVNYNGENCTNLPIVK